MKKILLWGCNGVIGKFITSYFSNSYYIVGVDVNPLNHADCIEYIQFSKSMDIANIYKNSFYCVIHCQQIKPEGFVKSNLLNLTEQEFDKIMNTNLKLSFLSSQAYINSCQSIKSEIKGRIINFTSTYSIISSNPSLYLGTEMGNPIHYTVSKAGLYGLTKYIASHFKNYGVLCNSISPHGIENNQSDQFVQNFSNRSPLGRMSKPREIMPAIEFLLNENNTYSNGTDIAVDGGWTSC